MEDLATLLREAIDSKGWSLREIEHESEKQGSRVSFSTVSKILKGSYKPGERILQGLSRALDIPIERLRAAAGTAEPGTPFRLPDYASRLSPEERSAVEHLVRVMVDAKDNRKAVADDEDSSTSIRRAAGSAAEDEEKVHRVRFDGDEEAEADYYGQAASPKEGRFRHDDPLDEQGI